MTLELLDWEWAVIGLAQRLSRMLDRLAVDIEFVYIMQSFAYLSSYKILYITAIQSKPIHVIKVNCHVAES